MKFGEQINSLEEYIPFPYKAGMLRLDANESCIEPSDEMKAEIEKAVRNVDLNRYPDPYCKTLRKTFGEFFGIDPDTTVVGNGSDELISIIFSSLLPSDSKTLTVAPDFSMYSFYASLYGRRNEVFNKGSDLQINVDELIGKINGENFDFVIFSNPCNPTGQGMSGKDVLKLVESTKAMICIDEAYMDFWDQNESVINEVESHENLLVLKTLSKAVGVASCRLGFAVSNKNVVSMFNKVKSPYNVNSVSQAIGTVILSHKAELNGSVSYLKAQVKKLSEGLKALDLKEAIIFDTKCNFVFVKIPDARRIYEELVNRNIVIRCFGTDRLRITAGTDAETEALLKALREITIQ